jgi:hypothetical protein
MKFHYSLAVALLCCSFVSAQAPQEFPSTSGNAFLRLCSAIDADEKDRTHEDYQHGMMCIAFVEGVVQGVSEEIGYAHSMTNKPPPAPFCLPDDVENGQIVRIVLRYIHNHPEEAHRKTSMLVALALQGSFPCRSKK